MRVSTKLAGLVAAAALFASTSAAQTCLGRPYFSTGPVQVSAFATGGNRTSAVGAELATGAHNSFFGAGSVSQTRYDRDPVGITSNSEGPTIGLRGGYQWSFGTRMATQFCPYVSGEWGRLDMEPDLDLNREEIAVGATMGWAPRSNNGVHFVPFVGASIAYLDRKLERANGTDVNFATRRYYPVTAGVGLHFDRSFMIIGNVMVPVELDRTDPVFGLRFVLPTGR